MKFLLAAINAKYIHSNPAVYSLRAYAKERLPEADIMIGEYTINHRTDSVLQDLYEKSRILSAFPVIYGTSAMCLSWCMICTRCCRA